MCMSNAETVSGIKRADLLRTIKRAAASQAIMAIISTHTLKGLLWDESAAGIGTEPDFEIRDLAKEYVAKDICPRCLGELDTGWECNDCGFDAKSLITKDSQ